MVLAIGHAPRAHEVLSCSDALSGFFEVLHRLFEGGVFVGHDQSIQVGILRSLDCFTFSRGTPTGLCSGREPNPRRPLEATEVYR